MVDVGDVGREWVSAEHKVKIELRAGVIRCLNCNDRDWKDLTGCNFRVDTRSGSCELESVWVERQPDGEWRV